LKPHFQLLTIQQGYPRRYWKNIGRLTTAFGGGDGDSEVKRLPWLEVPSGVPDPEGILDDRLEVNGPVPTFSISYSFDREEDGSVEDITLPWLEALSGVPDPEGILHDGLKVNGPVPTFSISCSLTGKNMVA